MGTTTPLTREERIKRAYKAYRKRIGKNSTAMSYTLFKKHYDKTRARRWNVKSPARRDMMGYQQRAKNRRELAGTKLTGSEKKMFGLKRQTSRTRSIKSRLAAAGVNWNKDRPSARLKRKKRK